MISEHRIRLRAADGTALEAALRVPPGATAGVVVCHPHPLYGGDMDNPVVTAVTGGAEAAGAATLRFNFRGVGGSEGRWDGGQGERGDVEGAIGRLRQVLLDNARLGSPSEYRGASRLRRGGAISGPPIQLGVAGYSFGAVVAAEAARGERLHALALIAPPLTLDGGIDVDALADHVGPLLIVAGDRDAYCPPPALARLRSALPTASVTTIPGADHFFGGHLEELRASLTRWTTQLLGRDE